MYNKNIKQLFYVVKKKTLNSARCATILPISTKPTITSHFKSLNIKKTTTYSIGNPGPGLDRHKNVTGYVLLKHSSNLYI